MPSACPLCCFSFSFFRIDNGERRVVPFDHCALFYEILSLILTFIRIRTTGGKCEDGPWVPALVQIHPFHSSFHPLKKGPAQPPSPDPPWPTTEIGLASTKLIGYFFSNALVYVHLSTVRLVSVRSTILID